MNNNDLQKLKLQKYDSVSDSYIDFFTNDNIHNYIDFEITETGSFSRIRINKFITGLNRLQNIKLNTAPNALFSALNKQIIKQNLGTNVYSDVVYLLDTLPNNTYTNQNIYLSR